jgi:hypothetical protein
MSNEQAIQQIVHFTEELNEVCSIFEVEGHFPPEVVLSMLIRVTRIYMDKCEIPLDRVMKALETAGN